jgi:hypothetical protein
MRTLSIGMIGALALGLTAHPLVAQSSLNQGFWYGAGLGVGFAKTACTICVSDRHSSYSAYFRLGATVTPNFLLGAEANGWMKDDGGIDRAMGSLSAIALWYPSRGSLFVKGGFGVISDRLDDDADALTSRALGVQIGIGYEFRIGRNSSLVPFVTAIGSTHGARNFNGTRIAGDATLSFLQIGLGMAWH